MLAVTVPEACPARQAPRVTAASTGWQGCQGRRATGATRVLPARQDPQERTERGAMMEKSDPGGCLGNRAPAVCLGPRDPPALLDLRV